ncbi:MAG: hypothetical protein ABI619_03415, partial [Betaproteobacteria bacterium]
MRIWLRRLMFNFFPAFRATGARVIYISEDMRKLRIKLPLNIRTRNIHGTLFGGAMYAATDPLYAILVKVHGHDSRVVSFTRDNAAGAARQQEKYAAAVERYKESLAILQAMGDPDPFLDAQTRQQYAASLDMVGRHDEALAEGRKADAFMRKSLA